MRIIAGGGITIPQDVREVYDIERGDIVEVGITKIYKRPKLEKWSESKAKT
ncbi:hypothetical protein [Thermococcus guaymasensis]|uniref:hypothetical protein n=1 Tax=Thermococcus guaymasensis TaxID=110164 RepID=UPI0012EBC89F|nr:hypothetical protein [Thermococcus guaymasensis]